MSTPTQRDPPELLGSDSCSLGMKLDELVKRYKTCPSMVKEIDAILSACGFLKTEYEEEVRKSRLRSVVFKLLDKERSQLMKELKADYESIKILKDTELKKLLESKEGELLKSKTHLRQLDTIYEVEQRLKRILPSPESTPQEQDLLNRLQDKEREVTAWRRVTEMTAITSASSLQEKKKMWMDFNEKMSDVKKENAEKLKREKNKATELRGHIDRLRKERDLLKAEKEEAEQSMARWKAEADKELTMLKKQVDDLHTELASCREKKQAEKDYQIGHHRHSASRLFCEICDQFDVHITDDCPTLKSILRTCI